MSKTVKIILTILTLGALAFFCFILFFIFGFSGQGFYMVLVAIAFFLLLALIPASIYRAFTQRITWTLWASVLAGIMIAVIGRESVRAYHQSFERIEESEVDLSVYMPFAENTLAVRLDSASTLQLTDSLPRMDGATALYPIYAAFAQAVYPEEVYPLYHGRVTCNTTPDAYDALIQGHADMIFVLQPSEDQLGYAAQQDIEMVFTPIGREAFVFFVNADNPVTGLTTGQLRGIYSGRITNWKHLAGKNTRIRAFQREPGSGSQTAFLKFMEGYEIMTPPQNDIVHGMGRMIERTAGYTNYPNAIGYTFRFYAESMVANKGIKLLPVDGVYPDTESIRDGRYPLSADFYAVTRAGEKKPNVDRMLDWILSPQGQSIIEKTGYNPIK